MKFADDKHLTPIGIWLKRSFERTGLTAVDVIVITVCMAPVAMALLLTWLS